MTARTEGAPSPADGAAAVGRAARVAICIATYRRPNSLERLLHSLASQSALAGAADAAVVVVDNDESGSAAEVVGRFAARWNGRVEYGIEPRRNIAHARNRAVEVGLEQGADFFAFIDDDEAARPDWLERLLETAIATEAAVIGGAVLPAFEEGAPRWIAEGGFFDIPRSPTGSEVRMAFTGNALIARGVFERLGLRFDPDFGRMGGEDSHLFMRLSDRGARIVWSDEAVVEETVPLSRATAGWILRRAYRVGSCTAHVERRVRPVHRWLPQRIFKAVLRIAEGTVLALPAALLGRRAVLRQLRKVAHGVGCLAGIARIGYREYDVVHGS